MKFRKGVFLGFVASGSAAAPDDWSTLPWTALEDLLSPSATLFKSADPVSTYKEECLPEFQKPFMERTNHNLINQPSGLCTDQLYCSFKQCVPSEEFMSPTEIFETVDMTGPPILIAGAKGENMPVNKTQFDIWIQSDNTAWNLPSYVLHPVFVGDVVAAIAFAKEHGLEVSVKNSGHVRQ